MNLEKPQTHWVCKHCSKEHPNKFIRCLRCGRLRFDIGVDAFLTKFLIAGGILVMFISLLILCRSLYSDTSDSIYLAKTKRLEHSAFTYIILAALACIAGIFFHFRVRQKKNEKI